jgi:uncharacterized protein
MNDRERMAAFLAEGPWAVAGASSNRAKFGNKVLRTYLQHGMEVYPINPRAGELEGVTCYPDVASLPPGVRGLSIITPPAITEQIVEQAAEAGIRHLWMQPGAESEEAIDRAEELGLEVIAGGPCILVELGFRG